MYYGATLMRRWAVFAVLMDGNFNAALRSPGLTAAPCTLEASGV